MTSVIDALAAEIGRGGDAADRARRLAATLAQAIRPPERLTVAEWAERRRRVSQDSGSPYPGRWRHDRTPYLLEIMEEMDPSSPATDIAIRKSAQTGATEAAMNLCGHTIDLAPRPILYVLPTVEEATKFNAVKWDTTVEATPELADKVLGETVKGRAGSTATRKRFRGGQMVIANAHSSSSLQMISAAVLICDEVSEYPTDAGGRGDPVEQARKRTLAWTRRRPKRVYLSTPGTKGHCRISALYDQSDQRRYYPPCPQCGHHVDLTPHDLRWRSERAPHEAYFVCPAHGCVIEEDHLEEMVNARGGRLWIKTYVDEDDPEGNPAPGRSIAPEDFDAWRRRSSCGRQPGFGLWQAISLLADWNTIVASHLAAKTPDERRAHTQQVLGEPYEERGDAPDAEKLYLKRPKRPLGAVPPGFAVLTGAVDVQGDRLEWAVYAWGPDMRSALVEYGVLAGMTDEPRVWLDLDGVLRRGWRDEAGREIKPDLWFLDAGFRSPQVYRFCQTRGGLEGRVAPVMGDSATTGPKAAVMPLVSPPRAVSYEWDGRRVQGAVARYDLGTWPLKVLLHEGLRGALAGPSESGRWPPGSIQFGEQCDESFFRQISAESLVSTTDRHGRTKYGWQKSGPNEQTDLWCYCRAAAELLGLGQFSAEEWERLAAARGAPQMELFGPQADIAQAAGHGTGPQEAPGGAKGAADPEPGAVRLDGDVGGAPASGDWISADDLAGW